MEPILRALVVELFAFGGIWIDIGIFLLVVLFSLSVLYHIGLIEILIMVLSSGSFN